MNSRYRSKGNIYVTLFVMVPVFFVLILSCGVPTYLYIGDSEIQMEPVVVVDQESFTVTVSLTEDALSEFQDKNTVPAVKLFYVLSTDALASSAISSLSSLSVSATSKSAFSSLFVKSNGNGDMWTPQSDSRATGFYIYDTDDSSVKYAASRPDYIADTAYDVIVASTFSYTDTATESGEVFATAPSMDIAMPIDDFKPEATPPFSGYSFSIRALDTAGMYSTIGLYDQDDVLIGYMNNERKDRFFGADTDTLTVEDIKNRFSGYDEISYRVLTEAIADNTSLYLHIFASLYGGNGDATNIYWSPLQSIGTLQLR
ncbi:MAG: hypothetical protein JXK93_05810 [Sphaerochaetaceae bacterium]|nr:hypothetical protein [Sphaerochaetaceae bacterium]